MIILIFAIVRFKFKLPPTQLTRSSLRSPTLFFASKKEGKKIKILEANPLYDLPQRG
jgi:hypothetical protein